jgi:hypothetical protein
VNFDRLDQSWSTLGMEGLIQGQLDIRVPLRKDVNLAIGILLGGVAESGGSKSCVY